MAIIELKDIEDGETIGYLSDGIIGIEDNSDASEEYGTPVCEVSFWGGNETILVSFSAKELRNKLEELEQKNGEGLRPWLSFRGEDDEDILCDLQGMTHFKKDEEGDVEIYLGYNDPLYISQTPEDVFQEVKNVEKQFLGQGGSSKWMYINTPDGLEGLGFHLDSIIAFKSDVDENATSGLSTEFSNISITIEDTNFSDVNEDGYTGDQCTFIHDCAGERAVMYLAPFTAEELYDRIKQSKTELQRLEDANKNSVRWLTFEDENGLRGITLASIEHIAIDDAEQCRLVNESKGFDIEVALDKEAVFKAVTEAHSRPSEARATKNVQNFKPR